MIDQRRNRGAVGGLGMSLVLPQRAYRIKGNIAKWCGTGVELEKRKRGKTILLVERRILEMVAREVRSPSLIAYADSWRGKPVASSRLSRCWTAIACGMATSSKGLYRCDQRLGDWTIGWLLWDSRLRGEPVIVEDVASDPLWSAYRDLACPILYAPVGPHRCRRKAK